MCNTYQTIQEELDHLQNKYKAKEEESASVVTIPATKYLCIRLDGFTATRNFLKDKLINNKFTNSLTEANDQLFKSFRHHLNKERTSSIVCSFIANDEVSVILNSDNNNFDNRIMKLCTLFSGVLSAGATVALNKREKNMRSISFDARPVLLDRDEITGYIRYRYLTAKRYAYWKTLRLNQIQGVFEDHVKKNADNCLSLAKSNSLEGQAQKILNTYSFFIPQKENKPDYEACSVNDSEMSEYSLDKKIEEYLDYLHGTLRN